MKFSKIASVLLVASALSACGDNNETTKPSAVNLLPEYQNRFINECVRKN